MYPDLFTSTVYPPALMLLKVYVPLVAVVVVPPVVLPLVTFKPLLTLRETPETAHPLTASHIVPEMVPAEQLSASKVTFAVIVWLSVTRVADRVASLKLLFVKAILYTPKLRLS